MPRRGAKTHPGPPFSPKNTLKCALPRWHHRKCQFLPHHLNLSDSFKYLPNATLLYPNQCEKPQDHQLGKGQTTQMHKLNRSNKILDSEPLTMCNSQVTTTSSPLQGPASEALERAMKRPRTSVGGATSSASFDFDAVFNSIDTAAEEAFPSIGWDFDDDSDCKKSGDTMFKVEETRKMLMKPTLKRPRESVHSLMRSKSVKTSLMSLTRDALNCKNDRISTICDLEVAGKITCDALDIASKIDCLPLLENVSKRQESHIHLPPLSKMSRSFKAVHETRFYV